MKNFKTIVLLYIIFYSFISNAFFEDKNIFTDGDSKNKSFFNYFSDEKIQEDVIWDEATKLFDEKKFKKAGIKFETYYKNFPNNLNSYLAVLMHGHSLMEQEKFEEAFSAYQLCIDNYSNDIKDFDIIMELQYKAATSFMNKKRMTLISGGYKSPELAIPLFEKIINNNPEWSKSSELLFLIGETHKEMENYEEAILVYKKIIYQYSNSLFYEKAFWKHIECLNLLLKKYPNSSEIQDRLLNVSTIYLNNIKVSDNRAKIVKIRNNLYEVKAKKIFDQGEFYKNIMNNDKAAILSFKSMIDNYPKSELVSNALIQIEYLEKKKIKE